MNCGPCSRSDNPSSNGRPASGASSPGLSSMSWRRTLRGDGDSWPRVLFARSQARSTPWVAHPLISAPMCLPHASKWTALHPMRRRQRSLAYRTGRFHHRPTSSWPGVDVDSVRPLVGFTPPPTWVQTIRSWSMAFRVPPSPEPCCAWPAPCPSCQRNDSEPRSMTPFAYVSLRTAGSGGHSSGCDVADETVWPYSNGCWPTERTAPPRAGSSASTCG